jgi:hypothetical protein
MVCFSLQDIIEKNKDISILFLVKGQINEVGVDIVLVAEVEAVELVVVRGTITKEQTPLILGGIYVPRHAAVGALCVGRLYLIPQACVLNGGYVRKTCVDVVVCLHFYL